MPTDSTTIYSARAAVSSVPRVTPRGFAPARVAPAAAAAPAARATHPSVPDTAAHPRGHPALATLRALIGRPVGAAGCVLVLVHLALALVGPALAPYDATEFHLADRLQPPSAHYLLGTDQFGRDILSRVLTGAPGMLLLAASATALGLLLGITVGLTAGYFGGMADEVMMRLMDAVMSFPSLLLALLILTMVGPETRNVVAGIGIVFMPPVARVVRSAVLGQRTLEYVQAARVRGERAVHIMTREILPNIRGPIVVEAAIRISYAILLVASLGFLGLGVQPPTPDWGLMISEARNFLLVAPWMAFAPAAAIATLVVGLNLVADGLSHEVDRR